EVCDDEVAARQKRQGVRVEEAVVADFDERARARRVEAAGRSVADEQDDAGRRLVRGVVRVPAVEEAAGGDDDELAPRARSAGDDRDRRGQTEVASEVEGRGRVAAVVAVAVEGEDEDARGNVVRGRGRAAVVNRREDFVARAGA